MPLVSGQRYFSSTAIFLNEILKLAVCLTIALYDISRTISPSLPATSLFTRLFSAVFTGDSWKVAVPACLYVLQNSLQYLAISNLESATYQVTYQFKMLPTAIFSVLLLDRKLSLRKWVALGLLMVGVAIVQTPSAEPLSLASLKDAQSAIFKRSWSGLGKTGASALTKRSATYEGIEEDDMMVHPTMNAPLGFAAAIGGCVVSAAASVYFEKVLKVSDSQVSLWIRNVQLAFYSLFPALFIGVIFVDGEKIAQNGFFIGYDWIVWTVIVFQALGGIIISMCVAYADNIAKGFAIAISILVSLVASIYVFDFKASPKVRLIDFLSSQALITMYNSFYLEPPLFFSRHISTIVKTIRSDRPLFGYTATRKQQSTGQTLAERVLL